MVSKDQRIKTVMKKSKGVYNKKTATLIVNQETAFDKFIKKLTPAERKIFRNRYGTKAQSEAWKKLARKKGY